MPDINAFNYLTLYNVSTNVAGPPHNPLNRNFIKTQCIQRSSIVGSDCLPEYVRAYVSTNYNATKQLMMACPKRAKRFSLALLMFTRDMRCMESAREGHKTIHISRSFFYPQRVNS